MTTTTMTTMVRKRKVHRGRTRAAVSMSCLTAPTKQPCKHHHKRIHVRRRRRAFAAVREKQVQWIDTARDTLRIVLGDGKYVAQSTSASRSPFQYAPGAYDIAPQIVLCQQGTTFYPHCSPDLANWRGHRANATPRQSTSVVQFTPESTLTAARRLVTENSKYTKQDRNALPSTSLGVLSFASPKRPGGGFLHGGDDQEALIARSTALVASLRTPQARTFYQTHRKFLHADGAGLHDHSMVYSPGVVALRNEDGATVEPSIINVLSSVPVNAAAIRQNYLITSLDAHVFEEGIRRTMRDRMARALRIFEARGDRALVLGAFGCGSSQNSVEMVAELWAELLVCGTREGTEGRKEEATPAKFKGVFEEIVFAVPGKHHAPFKRAFEMKVFEMEVISATSE